MKGSYLKHLTILALAPFLPLAVKAISCEDLALEIGPDDPVPFFFAVHDHRVGNEKHCDMGGTESPDELYSDAILMQSWAYCVKKFATDCNYGLCDWERLGLTNNEVGDKEGEHIWPYNQKVGEGRRFRRNRAARRVARKSSNERYQFIGGHFPALVGMLNFVADFSGSEKKEGAVTFLDETVGGNTEGKLDDLIGAFKDGHSHPTRVLTEKELDDLMDNCEVPPDKQEEYRTYADTFYVGVE